MHLVSFMKQITNIHSLMRKMSALVAPNGQETIIPMAVFACEKCGHVNKEFADVAGVQ